MTRMHAVPIAADRLPSGLLVSVRSVAEAVEAMAGGASIIDVKDPTRGPLGRAEIDVAAEIGDTVGGLAPWTLACGELTEGVEVIAEHCRRLVGRPGTPPRAIKAGPAGLQARAWADSFRRLLAAVPSSLEVVAVAYADFPAAGSPDPSDLIAAATAAGTRTVLIDTFDKSSGGLLETVGIETVGRWVTLGREAGMVVAVAGRLTAEDLPVVRRAGATIAGVRSAACAGRRQGMVERRHVAMLAGTLARTGTGAGPGLEEDDHS